MERDKIRKNSNSRKSFWRGARANCDSKRLNFGLYIFSSSNRMLYKCATSRLQISASRDQSIRVWELSDEIINVDEEEEQVREKEDFQVGSHI